MFTVSAFQNILHQQKQGKKEETPGKAANSNPDRIHPRHLGLPPLCEDEWTHHGHSHPAAVTIRETPAFRTAGLTEESARPQQEPGSGVEGRLNMPFFSPRGLGQAFLWLAPVG